MSDAMKVIVKFLGPIAKDDVEIEFETTDELKSAIRSYIDKSWLDKVAVAVNDKLVKSLENVKNGDVISLLPPVCGG